MIEINQDEYIREASLLLKNKDTREIKSFFLAYCMAICSKKIKLYRWDCFKYGDDIEEIKKEAISTINKELFSDWDIKHSDYEFIKWHKNYTLVYSEDDVLGKIYLLCSQEMHRKRMGEHYTRGDIVKYIISGLKEKRLLSKKIIDPCCGSGNFLIEILRYGFENCRTQKCKEIFINKIFSRNYIIGVDIQEIPCLVSKIRILLEVLKYSEYLDIHYKVPIFQKDSLKSDENIFSSQYDLVITNPPYLRYQLIAEKDRLFFKKKYKSAKGRFDLYVIFIERCIQLSKEYGEIIIVTSDKFMNAEYGKQVRSLIKDNNTLIKVQDLRDIFTFDASVLAAIYYIKKSINSSKMSFWEKVQEYNGQFYTINKGVIILNDTWRYVQNDITKVYNKIINNTKAKKLIDLCNISIGIQTTADKIFCEKKGEEKFKRANIERKLIYPILRGKTINKWRVGESYKEFKIQDTLLYPYIKENNVTKVIELEDFVFAKKYLLDNKSELEKRKYMKKKKWYEHLSPKNHKVLENIKIITPDLSSKCQFALDQEGYFCNGTVYFLQFWENRAKMDYLYLLALLNSNVIEFVHKNTNTVHLSSKKYRFQKTTMKNYPIVWLHEETDQYNKIILKVNEILNKEDANFTDIEKQINKHIYDIYNLDDNDREIIEKFIVEN